MELIKNVNQDIIFETGGTEKSVKGRRINDDELSCFSWFSFVSFRFFFVCFRSFFNFIFIRLYLLIVHRQKKKKKHTQVNERTNEESDAFKPIVY